jgi:hypothetical protein
MRELASSFAQLIFIIMATLALAVSTAAVSQWASADSGPSAGATTPISLVSAAR